MYHLETNYPLTLVLKLDLNIVKMYRLTVNEFPNCSGSKNRKERQTDMRNFYLFTFAHDQVY